jgi:hypothetical protein
MLERFLYFRKEINIVINKANSLSNSKKKDFNLESFNIIKEDWDYLVKIIDILEFFKKPTIKLQSSSSNSYTIIYIVLLYNKIKGIINIIEDPFLKAGLLQALEKLLFYFPIENTNINKLKDLYIITLLDPHFKLEIFYNLNLDKEIISNIKIYFIELYNRYKESNNIEETNTNIESSFNSNLDLYSNNNSSEDKIFLLDNINNTRNNILDNELELYLKEPRVPKDITIENYYNTNKIRFPIIYNIARDYLAILATSTPSEATFSKVGNIVTKSRNRLLSSTIKKLIILKEFKAIEDKEELINDNLLFKEDLEVKKVKERNKDKDKDKDIILIDEEESNLESKSTTSITSFNSNLTSNRSLDNSSNNSNLK